MGFLYLRFLIGGLNVLFVVIVACVTLALALTISFKSLRDNADTAVSRLGAVTAQKVDDFFATPQRQLDDLATFNTRYRDFGGLPSESPTFGTTGTSTSQGGDVLQAYRQLVTGLMKDNGFRYVSIILAFVDGSYVWQIPSYSAVFKGFVFSSVVTWPTGPFPTQQHPLVVTGHTVPGGAENAALTANSNQSVVESNPVTDLRIPQYRASVDYLYASGTRSSGSTVSWGKEFLFFTVFGHQFFLLPLSTTIVNSTGFMLGYAQLGLRASDVSALLTEGQLTPATRLVIYDADSYLFGASSGVAVYTAERFNGTDSTRGCATTAASAALLPSDVQMRACRYHLRDTPIPMVQTAAQKDLTFFMQATTAGAVRLVGSQYVYVQKLPTLEGARAFTIAMVVPEEDMIGDAAKILPICAGVTAGVVVLVAAVSLVLVWLVLRPLQGIAERMGKAARLEADDEAVSVSSLVEIGDLQRAFLEMRDELSRIRAFVPQSLLHANDEDTEEEEFADEHVNLPPAFDVASSATSRTTNTTELNATASSLPHERSSEFGSAETLKHHHPRAAPSEVYAVRSRRGSGSTVQSRRHAHRKPKQLHLAAGVRQENVSVLSMNLRGFHGAVKDGLGVERVAATVEAVLRIAQQEKGVVDSFHGDRFLVSFNAVKPAASHGIRAAIVAARVAEALGGGGKQGTVAYALPVTAGVATGPAQVGNLGSSEMKRFSIVGPVVSQAACLERLCKLYGGASCLVPQRLFADLRTAVLVKTVDYVRVPFAERPMLVGAVLRELSQAADDEWMYQLQQAAEGDGKGAGDFSPDGAAYVQMNNDVWDALVCGRTGDACAMMDTFEEKATGQVSSILKAAVSTTMLSCGSKPEPTTSPPTATDSLHTKRFSERQGSRIQPTSAALALAPRDFGAFYNEAMLNPDAVEAIHEAPRRGALA